MKKNSMGLQYLIGVLGEAKKLVEEEGYVSKECFKKLVDNFGGEENSLSHWCWTFSKMATEGPQKAKEDPENYGDTPPPDKCKKMILKLLDDEKKKILLLKPRSPVSTSLQKRWLTKSCAMRLP